MIPKTLHFIWFGKKPAYCDFAIAHYKQVNPDFSIHACFRTVEQIEAIACSEAQSCDDDIVIKSCIDAILNGNSEYDDLIARSRTTFKMSFVQVLADICRLAMLNKHGGIYLDCDTLPMKAFDEQILSRPQFSVSLHMVHTNEVIPDYYFIGKDLKSLRLTSYYTAKDFLLQTDKNWWNDVNYMQRKINFFRCRDCNVPLNTKFYIEHYCDNTWIRRKNCESRTPKCRFDTNFSH